MKKDGYLIARNRKADAFFTSSSAYDRPSWIVAETATAYRTIELAEHALKKILRAGAYEARIVPLSEAISLELPPEEEQDPNALPPNTQQSDVDAQGNPIDPAAQDGQMVAGGDPAAETDADGQDEEGDDAEMNIDIEADVDADLGDDVDGVDPEADAGPIDDIDRSDMPTDDPVDPMADPNAIPGDDEGAPDLLDKPRMESAEAPKPVVMPDVKGEVAKTEETVKVPASIISAVRSAAAKHKAEGDKYNARDDGRATFALTVAAAFEELADLLADGDIKMAQVKMFSWMSPITRNLPDEAHKFVQTGGKKASLLDMFTSARADKKAK